MRLHIGVDDTDSTRQGCTTYIGALIVEKLLMENVEFNDYPNLIRLNPNIPWKTRGNGAIALRINIEEEKIDEIERIIIDTVAENADLECEKTQPGIAFLMGDVSRELERFAVKAMRRLITIEASSKYSFSATVFASLREAKTLQGEENTCSYRPLWSLSIMNWS